MIQANAFMTKFVDRTESDVFANRRSRRVSVLVHGQSATDGRRGVLKRFCVFLLNGKTHTYLKDGMELSIFHGLTHKLIGYFWVEAGFMYYSYMCGTN